MGWGEKYECIIMDGTKRAWLEEIGELKGGEGDDGDVIIDSVFGFDNVKEAFERMDTGRCRGKVVVRVEEGE